MQGKLDIQNFSSKICMDVDQCLAGENNCHENAHCFDEPTGFQCKCKEGYEGDGISCTAS